MLAVDLNSTNLADEPFNTRIQTKEQYAEVHKLNRHGESVESSNLKLPYPTTLLDQAMVDVYMNIVAVFELPGVLHNQEGLVNPAKQHSKQLTP